MHIYGVGSTGNLGSSVQLLMDKKYNQSKEKMGGRSFKQQTIPATVNAGVVNTKLTMDSNRVSKISRPFLTMDAEVRDVWAEVDENIDHVSFLPENRPSLKYVYPLNNEEIKGFIDAGMYHNPQFEELLDNLLESEQFEITSDVDVRAIDVINEGDVTPVVLVQDLDTVEQALGSDEDEDFTSFDYAIERAIDMALQLEAEGISTTQLLGETEPELREVDLDLAEEEIFEVDRRSEEDEANQDIEADIIRQLEEMDDEVDLSDEIEPGDSFGQTSEEQRISQLRDAAARGVDWDDLDSNDDYDHNQIEDDRSDEEIESADVLSPEDDYEFGADEDELDLTDEMEIDLDLDDEDENEPFDESWLEDEDEDELEF